MFVLERAVLHTPDLPSRVSERGALGGVTTAGHPVRTLISGQVVTESHTPGCRSPSAAARNGGIGAAPTNTITHIWDRNNGHKTRSAFGPSPGSPRVTAPHAGMAPRGLLHGMTAWGEPAEIAAN